MSEYSKRFSLSVLAVILATAAADAAENGRKEKSVRAPFPLAKCAVSGEPLGSMGDPVIYRHEGREIRFCCKGCVGKFKKDSSKYLAVIDREIVKLQGATYPLETCIVSGKKLGTGGMEPVDWVYDNRLVRLCCKMCKERFLKDREKSLARLDQAVIAKQLPGYPLETCPVSGEQLGSMGKPVDHVVAGRLVRLCCAGCKKKVNGNPVAALKKVDAALTHEDAHGDHAGDSADPGSAQHPAKGAEDHSQHKH